MTRKLQYFLTSLFIIGWLFLFGPSVAIADEPTVQVIPATPSSDTATATTPVTVEIVAAKVETVETTLQQAAETQAAIITTTIQANVPNTTAQQAATIATTQEPIANSVAEATVKVQEATTAIQSAKTAVSVARTAQAAVESQTAIVAVATTNLNTAQTNLNTVTQQVESQTAVVATDITNVTLAKAAVESSTVQTTTNGVTQTVYHSTGGGSPQVANQNPISVTQVPYISAQWGNGSVAGGPSDNVIVKYEGTITAPQDAVSIRYAVYSDDGARLYVDGQLAINNWQDQGPTWSQYSPQYNVTEDKQQNLILWYYENGGGANVTLGWAVYTATGAYFTTPTTQSFGTTVTVTDPAAIDSLNSAQSKLNADTVVLNTLKSQKTTAQAVVVDKTEVKAAAITTLTQLTETATATVQVANTLANTATTKVNASVSAMTNAAQVTVSYYDTQRAIAAENARIAAEAAAAQAAAERAYAEAQAKAAAEAAAKAEAEAKAAAEAAAKAEADRIAAEAAAIKAEADRVAAEEAAAKAEQEAKEKAEADAKAEAERLEAEAEAARQAEEQAKAEAEAKAQEEANAKAEAEAKQAEADKLKAEADAKKAEQEALDKAIEDAKEGKELTEDQKDAVVESLIKDLKPGEALSSEDIKSSGIEYKDLPPATPVDVRTDENGNAVVITAAVAAQVELLQNPGALVEELFTNPAAAIAALGSIGADMSDAEREEATDMVVATVVAAGAAINAAAVATGGATGGGTGGGGSSGGGSGANSPGSRGGRRW